MTPTTYGRDFAYCLKSHGGVRGFNASLWRFLLRCTLFCHSVATFLTSVSSYEGGCGFEDNNVCKAFRRYLDFFPGLMFCVYGHNHDDAISDIYNDGLIFYGIDCAQHRNYRIFTITPDGYEVEHITY